MGVVLRPRSSTSIPNALRVLITSLCTNSPLIRPSRPITTFLLSLARDKSQVPYAAVKRTTSSGLKVSPGLPPIVPLIPEMLLINAIIHSFASGGRAANLVEKLFLPPVIFAPISQYAAAVLVQRLV